MWVKKKIEKGNFELRLKKKLFKNPKKKKKIWMKNPMKSEKLKKANQKKN